MTPPPRPGTKSKTTDGAPTLKEEIRQTREFSSPEAEVYLNLLRTTEALIARPNAHLREFGLSPSQYNVLRILRGAKIQDPTGTGVPCREIVARMVTRDSDMTRLLDGLESKQLVERERSATDRRVIEVRLSTAGEALLAELDAPVDQLHRDQLGHLGERKLRQLSRLLEEARSVV